MDLPLVALSLSISFTLMIFVFVAFAYGFHVKRYYAVSICVTIRYFWKLIGYEKQHKFLVPQQNLIARLYFAKMY